MITKEFLAKIGFQPDDAECIIELNGKYLHKIEPLVEEYTMSLNTKPFFKYTGDDREIAYKKAQDFIKNVYEKIPEIDEKTARLLGWVNL